ncbi:MAG: hypothetical protein JRL30_01120 [Deltaproteobacteria bacterium]|nr:hypothetical protein [Deltaproteobacteria bacterium]
MLDPVVLDPIVHAVFDVRIDPTTGEKAYIHVITKSKGHFDMHPFGEGNGKIFEIREGPLSELKEDNFWCWDESGDCPKRVPTTRLVAADCAAKQRVVASGLCQNVRKHDKAATELLSTADAEAHSDAHNTRMNDTETVGTSKTHATISAAVSAASDGDAIQVFAGGASNNYNEAVSIGKQLMVYGMVADQGITISKNTGSVVAFSDRAGEIHNFTIDGLSGATVGVGLDSQHCRAFRCIVVNVNGHGMTFSSDGAGPENCLAYDCTTGFWQGGNAASAVHCTAVDCTTGFHGNTTDGVCIGCLAIDNTTDYTQSQALFCRNNGSKDATAPGGGPVTGLTDAVFTSRGTDDFTLLNTSVACVFEGVPRTYVDATGALRKRDGTPGKVYMGYNDPDTVAPASAVTAGDVKAGVTINGVLGTRTDALEAVTKTGSGTYGADGTEFAPSYVDEGAPDIDLRLQVSGADAGKVAPGATITIVGGVTSRKNAMTTVPTKVELFNSSDVLQSTPIPQANVSYTKDSQKTWATIKGSAATFTAPAAGNGYYVRATVEDEDGNEYTLDQTFDSFAVSVPGTPTIGAITHASTVVTIPVTGVVTEGYVYIKDKDGTSLVDNSGDPLVADGDETLTLPALGVFGLVEVRNKSSDSWGIADIKWLFFGVDDTANEILAYVIDELQANSTLVALLNSSADIRRGFQPNSRAVPQITLSILEDPDTALDTSADSRNVTLEVNVWGYSPDVIAQIQEQVDAVLYDNRDMDTTAWRVQSSRRSDSFGPQRTGIENTSTGKELWQLQMTFVMKARKK